MIRSVEVSRSAMIVKTIKIIKENDFISCLKEVLFSSLGIAIDFVELVLHGEKTNTDVSIGIMINVQIFNVANGKCVIMSFCSRF